MITPQSYSAYARIKRLPEFPGLELLRASYQTRVFPRHWNETFIMQLVEQGVNEFYCEGKIHTAPAGSIVLLNAYEVHTGRSAGKKPLVYRSLYFAPELFSQMAGQILQSGTSEPLLAAHVVQDAKLASLIRKIHYTAEAAPHALQMQTALLHVLSRLLRHYSNQSLRVRAAGSETAAVRRAREYLHVNFDKNISLAELAHHSYLSPFHLLRSFRKATGMPPHEYLTNVRVERAKQFLTAGMPISQVAHRTGFTDQSHLHRRFKTLAGLTPGQFFKMSNFVQDCESAAH